MEDEFVSREKKILSIIEQEIADGGEMAEAVRHMAQRLLVSEWGYAPEDIRKNVGFDVVLGSETVRSFLDFLVTVNQENAMVIKCAAGALSSRERHVVAAARAFGEKPIPVAVVMDPMNAVVLDGVTGKVRGEGFDAVPRKDQLVSIVDAAERKPLTPEKLDREKRVLLAFDAIQCSIPRGADGGVAIGEPEPGEEA